MLFDYVGALEVYFRAESNYVRDLIRQVVIEGKHFPIVRLELERLFAKVGEEVLERFRTDVEMFINDLRNALIRIAVFESDFKDIYDSGQVKIHVIPKHNENTNYLIPVIQDFSRDLTKLRGRLILLVCRFMSIGFERLVEFETLVWRCSWCGTEFETMVNYRQTTEKYKSPDFCINAKCKARTRRSFDLIQKKCKTFEKRRFTVIDLKNQDIINEIECYITSNIPYFTSKAKDLHTNDELEILGILKMDTADLSSSKDVQIPEYFIEVVDISASHSSDINEDEIKRIKQEIKKDRHYPLKLLDSIHPYSQGIFNFLPIKIILNLSWSTSDCYTKLRNGINAIHGGHAGTLKSKISEAFSDLLGKTHFFILDGKDTTAKGLIPTAQRNNNEKNLVKRNGAIAYCNRKALIIDEAHHMYKRDPEALASTKCYERGYINRALDGSIINAEAKGTLTFLVNYSTDDEAFDFHLSEDRLENILKNLGFPTDKSILDRFDLHNRIPVTSDKINQILVKRDSDNFKPRFKIPDYTIKNYLLAQKRVVTKGITIPKDIEKVINELYQNIIAKEKSKLRRTRNPREVRIIKKTLRAIAAMFLRSEVNEDDILFLRKYLLNTVIPFQDNPYIVQQRIIDEDYVFRNAFDLLTELYDNKYFDVTQFIEFFREYLESNFFMPYQSDLDKILGPKQNLSNKRFKTLLDNNREYILAQGYYIDLMHNKTHFINVDWIREFLKKRIMAIFKEIEFKPVEENALIQILELEGFTKELICRVINGFKSEEFLKIKEGKLLVGSA